MRIVRVAALLLPSMMAVAGVLMPADGRADYPTRFVKILVPYPAGGATDVLTRLVAKELQERLGQPFIVDNKPGAATNIAATLAARAAPDGYTLFLATIASHALNKWSYKKLEYVGIVPFVTTRQETADFLKQQSEKWGPIIKSVGIRFE